ncbi:MAG: DNA translocase FtsK [Ruminococcus sp.]|nr:DNA translocase FtsK [Ruminococcus sp.]
MAQKSTKTKKKPAGKAASSRTPKEEALEKLNRRQDSNMKFQSVLLFTAAILFFLIAFIQGSAGWYLMHRFVRGVFGFSILIVPVILLVSAYYTERRSGMSLARRLIFGFGLTVLVSSFIQIIFVGDIEKKTFFRAISYLYENAAENAFQCGGVISAILAYPLIRILGATGARIIIVLLLFVALMWMLDLSVRQLFGMLLSPFRKLRELWNREPDWADEENDRDFRDLPESPQEDAKEKRTLRLPQLLERALQSLREETAQEDLEQLEPEETVADEMPSQEQLLSPELDAFINQYNMPPSDDGYDMDVDIPLFPEDVPPVQLQPVKAQEAEPAASPAEVCTPQASLPIQTYQIPPLDFLQSGVSRAKDPAAEQEMKENAGILVDTLSSFGVTVRITGISRGPSVTRYEIQPAAGIKVSKITGLADDITLSLAAQGVRIEAPVPGKPVIGIEVPNGHKDTVSLREILESDSFRNSKSKLMFAVGRDIAGNAVVGDIAKLPHMIIAGATGSGKSVCTNSIIMSILYHAAPDEVKLILIDPKIVEFTVYEGIPHLLIPVVTDPKQAAGALNWAVQEMQRRYNLFAENSVRDLDDFNLLAAQPDSELERMPQIVVIIDELADLMMTTSKEVEDAICRLAQKARAAGMHLIIATQRPTTDIITGLIKANIPSRIALSVMSQVDSRTILDSGGAEKLLGHGDMLYLPNGKLKPIRVQGCLISTKEIEKTVSYIKEQMQSSYNDEIMEQVEQSIPVTKAEQKEMKAAQSAESCAPEPGSDEEVLERAIEFVVEAGHASTSSLQRRLKLGYARAARMMDELEEMGVIGPYEGAKPRKVLMTKEQFAERKLRRLQ